MFSAPALTISQAAKLLDVTPRAARLNIDKLVDAEILTEIGGRSRYKVFLAQGVIDAVEGIGGHAKLTGEAMS